MHQKCNFICNSEVSWLLIFKSGPKGQTAVLVPNTISELKTKQVFTIYDDVIIMPEILPTNRAKFSESVTENLVFGGFSVGDLPYHIEDWNKTRYRLCNDDVINFQTTTIKVYV